MCDLAIRMMRAAWLPLAGAPAAAVLPKSRFAGALGYLRNHWEPLQVYLSDGRLPIDNNDVEQLMKQVALGRKNWLFIGSVAAAMDVQIVCNREPIDPVGLKKYVSTLLK